MAKVIPGASDLVGKACKSCKSCEQQLTDSDFIPRRAAHE